MATPVRLVMTNPAELLLAGNPGRKRGKSKSKANAKKRAAAKNRRAMQRMTAALGMFKGAEIAAMSPAKRKRLGLNPSKPARNAPMAKKSKKRRSAAQRAATARMLAANRAKRSGRKAKRSARKAHRSSKRRALPARTRHIPTLAGSNVAVYKVSGKSLTHKVRGKRRLRPAAKAKALRRRKPFRSVHVNPGFAAGLTGFGGNLKALTSGGIKTWAAGLAGGIGAVAGGTVVKRIVGGVAEKVMPGAMAHPVAGRVIAFGSYYGVGWLLARYLPVSNTTKKAILASAVIAGAIETMRPGAVQGMVARIPVVGPIIGGGMSSIEGLGEYAMNGLAGMGLVTLEGDANNARWGDVADDIGGDDDLDGLGLVTLDDSLGEYAMNGLGCSPAESELMPESDG